MVSCLFTGSTFSLVLSVRYCTEKSKTVTPSRLQAKPKTSTLHTGKLCHNAIIINVCLWDDKMIIKGPVVKVRPCLHGVGDPGLVG